MGNVLVLWQSPKDPADVRRYELDCVDALPAGQTIASATAERLGFETPDPVPGGGAAAGVVSGETTVVYAWVAGGEPPSGSITWTITTSAGEVLHRTLEVVVAKR